MNKYIKLLLSALLVLTLLSACRSSHTTTKHSIDASKGSEYRVQ